MSAFTHEELLDIHRELTCWVGQSNADQLADRVRVRGQVFEAVIDGHREVVVSAGASLLHDLPELSPRFGISLRVNSLAAKLPASDEADAWAYIANSTRA